MKRFWLTQLHVFRGFGLIEVMISLVMGGVLISVMARILVATQTSSELNQALASVQEDGRFVMTKIRQQILSSVTGYEIPTETKDASLSRPIILTGDYARRATLGSRTGSEGESDTLVVKVKAIRDCRGYSLGHEENQSFVAVNEYFIEQNKLKCRGFDHEFLTGEVPAVGANGHKAVTLMENVMLFKVRYGVVQYGTHVKGDTVRLTYMSADQLLDLNPVTTNIVALQIALMIRSEADVKVPIQSPRRVLTETVVPPAMPRLVKVFETTLWLRSSYSPSVTRRFDG